MIEGEPQVFDTPLDRIWDALQEVKDPEIPSVSVVELGLVRQVGFEGSTLIVTLAPTFVGCPALDVMRSSIEGQLTDIGVDQVDVRLVFKPPWTSDWITPEGREKLKQIGLSPPPVHNGQLEQAIEAQSTCPYCESSKTELKNSFGSTLCRAIYFCNNCQQPFEQFKPI